MSLPFSILINNCRIVGAACKYLSIVKSPYRVTWSQVKWYTSQKDDFNRGVIIRDVFQNVQEKNRRTYLEMLDMFKEKEYKRRDYVGFIYSALKYMKEFGVEKDLEVYKSLIDIFPKGKMVARNVFQAEFMHYPKQQQCAIDILEQMEENGVMPDWDMQDQLMNVFGRRGYPLRRYWRMMYWMPKFKNASPWYLPNPVPHDAFQLAMLAMLRITTVDSNSDVTIMKTSDVKDSIDDTWIISGQSEDQMDLLNELPEDTTLYVEGRFRIWLRDKAVTYFVLRADFRREEEQEENTDDVGNLKLPFFSKPTTLLRKPLTIHEQDNGTVLAVCSTGTSSRDSLLSWIRLLEKTNPRLGKLPVIFTLKSPIGDSLVALEEDSTEGNKDTPAEKTS